MTASRAIWLGLATLAAVWGVFLGVPFRDGAVIYVCAILPPLVGTFMRGTTTDARIAEIESTMWVVLATLGVASTAAAPQMALPAPMSKALRAFVQACHAHGQLHQDPN